MSAYIFDTETTSANDPHLIEAAWLAMSDDIAVHAPRDVFLQRYSTDQAITFCAMAVHHILPSDLVGSPPNTEFRLPNDIEYMIGHNVDFDWKVAGSLNVKRICTLAMARFLWPEADSHTLGSLSYMLSTDLEAVRLELRDAHNALADCYLCARVLFAIIEHCGEDLKTWEDVYQFSERARIPTRMPFGKHAGTPIKDIPYDYRAWLLRQTDVDPYLRKALESKTA
ncbi:Exodeoxyribonuclease 10 [Pandoraea communis]|uniref:Exodeoxyribonuclease 10 n=1 Tax=Pandoraea communis TaxID=2508297 RepID=A0A5E4TWU7_9BURK|nr:DUF3820 family protein [Pandoraea communis]VVD91218.1 Exodeoxyribonuclease 10 [Pandoraea communis]